jgi:hypothetical protein
MTELLPTGTVTLLLADVECSLKNGDCQNNGGLILV